MTQNQLVLFVLLAVAAGVTAGWLLGGSMARLAATPLHGAWALVPAIGLQLGGALLASGAAYSGCLLASLVIAVGFLALNPGLAGRPLIALGLTSNAVAIAVNGGMPVSGWAAGHAGVSTQALVGDPRHLLATSGTHLTALTDIVPLALPFAPQVLSVGDILVAVGTALLIARGMRRRIHESVAITRPSRPAALQTMPAPAARSPRPAPLTGIVSRPGPAPRREPFAAGRAL